MSGNHSGEPNYDWEDITDFVDEMAKGKNATLVVSFVFGVVQPWPSARYFLSSVMDVGEMICTDDFSLGEVMSASEVCVCCFATIQLEPPNLV